MNRTTLSHSAALLLAAVIWGAAFAFQSMGSDVVPPLTFCFIRSVLGALVLIPLILIRGKDTQHKDRSARRYLVLGGIMSGFWIGVCILLQQISLTMGTSAGKAGFLTACYIVLVPILGLFVRKKCGWNVWAAVAITVGGLYLLCINGPFTIRLPDLLVLGAALACALQILTVDACAPHVDVIRFSCIQFAAAAGVCLIPMIVSEIRPFSGGFSAWAGSLTTWKAWIPMLYAGIMSSGVAYTLQNVGQRGLNPTVASLIMSLESVFSVLSGWVLLNQRMSGRELMGCALIFTAVVLAQIPLHRAKKTA